LSAPNARTTTADGDGIQRDRELAVLAQLELDQRQKHFVDFRYLGQLRWLEGKARGSQRNYYRLRTFAIVGGLVVPALVSLNIKDGDAREPIQYATVVVSLLVAVAIAIENFYRYGNRWRHYRLTAELLRSEGWQFYELTGPYSGFSAHGEAFAAFSGKVEQLLSADVDTYVNRVVREGQQDSGAEAKQGG